MTHKLMMAVVVIGALLFGVLAQTAAANNLPCPIEEPPVMIIERGAPNVAENNVAHAECARAEAYPGPFTNHPAAPIGPHGIAALNITAAAPAAAAAGTGGGDSAAPLAVTGSESQILGYLGTGLIAFGAVAMGSRRRFLQNALD